MEWFLLPWVMVVAVEAQRMGKGRATVRVGACDLQGSTPSDLLS